jgi:calmodulin
MQTLVQEEVDQARAIFSRFDKDGSGKIDGSELRSMLSHLGHEPSDEEVFLMLSQVDVRAREHCTHHALSSSASC